MGQRAEAAYQIAQLAYGRIDYVAACQYSKKATDLQHNNRRYLELIKDIVDKLCFDDGHESGTSDYPKRFYIYKDDGATENNGEGGNIMPERAAETKSFNFKMFSTPGYDKKEEAVKVSLDLKKPPNWGGLVVLVQQDL